MRTPVRLASPLLAAALLAAPILLGCTPRPTPPPPAPADASASPTIGNPGDTPPAQPTTEAAMHGIEDVTWLLVDLPTSTVPTAGQRPSLRLDAAERTASGSGGCNRWQGPYELGPETLRFGALAATQMACADGMEVENAFFMVLDTVRRWRFADGRLELLDEAGGLLARFEPATSG